MELINYLMKTHTAKRPKAALVQGGVSVLRSERRGVPSLSASGISAYRIQTTLGFPAHRSSASFGLHPEMLGCKT
jgi:hypothetical protein